MKKETIAALRNHLHFERCLLDALAVDAFVRGLSHPAVVLFHQSLSAATLALNDEQRALETAPPAIAKAAAPALAAAPSVPPATAQEGGAL